MAKPARLDPEVPQAHVPEPPRSTSLAGKAVGGTVGWVDDRAPVSGFALN